VPLVKIDLYADGGLGAWAVKRVQREYVRQIFTTDEKIVQLATDKKLTVHRNHAMQEIVVSPIGISLHYHRICSALHLRRYKAIYNIHPSLVPWGRGYYPVFWALWEQTAAGASLMVIDERIDGGSIIDQIPVQYSSADTGYSLHKRVQNAERALFVKYWPEIIAGRSLVGFAQDSGGTYHNRRDFYKILQHVDLCSLSGSDVLRLVRALTFNKMDGLHVDLGDKKMQLCLRPLKRKGRES
jgi:methionyl-tRNA formyltransferase